MTWPFGALRPLSYGLIMADPPWSYDLWSEKGMKKSAMAQYACMSDQDVCDLPVGQLARGDAVLWLWATAPKLDVAFRVMTAWGFKYRTFGTWDKVRWGTGYIMRSVAEPFLIGTIGKPVFDGRSIPNIIRGGAREHSRKPEQAYEIAAYTKRPQHNVRRLEGYALSFAEFCLTPIYRRGPVHLLSEARCDVSLEGEEERVARLG